jgi:alpha-galactosidase
VKNANVLRGPLSLRAAEYGVGLGVHSQMRVTYDVQAGDHEFRSTVGIDDAAGGKGSVRFSVDVDDRRAWSSPEITGRSPALAIPPVKLKGAKKLTLIVDFGANADVLDYADWCDAIVVRE